MFNVIGRPIERVDGKSMVSGRAVYGVDVRLPGMLCGKVLRSPIPHGKLLHIDVEKARKLPGVKAVITAKDVPSRRFGFAIQDETIFAIDTVRYVGDAVAAVAAVDEETAEDALGLIDVEYEDLPAVFDPEKACLDGAPLVHEEMTSYLPNRGRSPTWKPVPGTNIIHQAVHAKGDVEAALAKSDFVFEDTFRTSQIHHCYMEPHAAVAQVESGKITVWSCAQEVFPIRSNLANLFGVPESSLHIIATKVGGGFGGKIAPRLEQHAIALAWKTHKPVKIVMTRPEEFTAAAGSAPAVVYIKTGVQKDGTLKAREMRFIWDTGAYSEGLPPSNRALKDGIGPYRLPDFKITTTLVYTNKLRATPLRGLGVPESTWAVESQMDMIAHRLGIDPLEFRLKNALDDGDTNSVGDPVYSIGLKQCLREAAMEIGWGKPKGKNIGRGLALISKTPTTTGSISGAYVHFNEDGSAQVLVGASEIGQGSLVALSQIAAEELGIPVESVAIVSADTAVCPFDQGTFSSRVTLYTGMAVKTAAAEAKKQLLEIASQMTEIPERDLEIDQQKIISRKHPELNLSFREVIERAHTNMKPILGKGWAGGKGDWPGLPHKMQGKEPTPGSKYGAQAVEVKVDEETGVVTILKMASAHDAGQTVNPLALDGQIVGGSVMGMGYALYEKIQFEDGKVINPSFMDYKIPSSHEVPEIVPIRVEVPLPEGPFGAKGAGELAGLGVAPAVANAIFDAVQVRIKQLPLEPETVLDAIERKT
ncbi:MAG: xanthine dehydrogenase family protein molybdopterin-binding subunit [Deltaproteobacteria bacterium]|nr:xanthine dehydrogenase family protein molybdopterin-binding subunit [Deltaproteobacteria bacterium]